MNFLQENLQKKYPHNYIWTKTDFIVFLSFWSKFARIGCREITVGHQVKNHSIQFNFFFGFSILLQFPTHKKISRQF